ncbi:hypothetical protein [Herbiconiux sp. VKM Ac-2851]|uniref:hypothetical protein n=1 Tax=Herbiconiux sp. VKM Ac-2851 TaxID=2739025 RepID=UPI0015676C66|nr:hypothetical protein [Herbiconiux sp. VKM Ac-2851]NQX33873.1 hypothetical protein [Herbiconiux sp. VKM Ac-2851]
MTGYWLVWELLTSFGAALWEFVKALIVPLAAAAAAAYVVVLQMRRSEANRVDERRGVGVKAAANLIVETSRIGFSLGTLGQTSPDRLSGQEATNFIIDVHSNLVASDRPIAHWAMSVYGVVLREQQALWVAVVEYQAKGYFGAPPDVRPQADALIRRAGNAVDRLLAWQRGDLPTPWFSAQLDPTGSRLLDESVLDAPVPLR